MNDCNLSTHINSKFTTFNSIDYYSMILTFMCQLNNVHKSRNWRSICDRLPIKILICVPNTVLTYVIVICIDFVC